MDIAAQAASGRCGEAERELVRAAFEALSEGLIIIQEQRILLANTAAAKLLGHDKPDELAGRPLQHFFPDESWCRELLQGSPKRQCDRHNCELKARQRDGTQLNVAVRCAGFQSGKKALLLMAFHLSQMVHLSRLAKPRQEMEFAGLLAQDVAHQLNNLITGILLYCDLLLGQNGPGDGFRRHVEEIRLAGEQGAALTGQLRAMSRDPERLRQVLLNLMLDARPETATAGE